MMACVKCFDGKIANLKPLAEVVEKMDVQRLVTLGGSFLVLLVKTHFQDFVGNFMITILKCMSNLFSLCLSP